MCSVIGCNWFSDLGLNQGYQKLKSTYYCHLS